MSILIKPIITEKMTAMSEKLNRYAFVVDKKANKIEIKSAVEKMYGVSVTNVRTNNYIGKLKSRNTKSGIVTGVSNSHKKAIVELKAGEMIDFYSNI
jgi:large subunit ribosomal protein L23